MASDFQSTDQNSVADSPPWPPQPDDDNRYDFGFPITLSDPHFEPPSSDQEFEHFDAMMFGEEAEAVGMRRRRRGSAESGGGKRARVVGSDEAVRRGIVVCDEMEVGEVERLEDRVEFGRWNSEMSIVDYVNGNDRVGSDLNLATVDYLGLGESVRDALNGAELGLGQSADERKGKNVIYIDSNNDDADVQNLDWGIFSETGYVSALKSDVGIELKLGMIDVGSLGLSGEASGSQRRYTREEKGKGILVSDDWLSIATANHKLAYSEIDRIWNQEVHEAVNGQLEEFFWPDVDCTRFWEPEEYLVSESIPAAELPLMEPLDKGDEPPLTDHCNLQDEALLTARRQAIIRRQGKRRYREIAKDNAFHLAHPRQFNASESPPKHEIEEITGPFSMAMQNIIEHKEGKHKPRSQVRSFTIDWTPSRGQDCKLTATIPSLFDLSLATLAKNAESVVSLEPAPDALKHKISQAACDSRKMGSHLLEIYISESPTEVYVKDCSWMTEEQLVHIFGNFDSKKLTVLQLDLCGQALTDYTLGTTLAKSKNCLPSLAVISLKSGCRLTDTGLALIVESALSLQSVNLSQCSLLTVCGINTLADHQRSTLKELYLDDCHNINMLSILPAVTSFEHLEVLSVSGIDTVTDEFVRQFICARGSNLKELNLADCQKLTDISLKVIGQTCPQLRALDVSNVSQLTDATIEYIANGCRSIQKLKFCRNAFSDEAVASFLEVSGQSLKELSLNHISKVGPYTALSLAKQVKGLLSLDLSWCRKLTDAAVGLVVDSCLSLRLLKLFGCTQITEVFLNGHSNPTVEIIGLNQMPVLKQLSAIDPQPGPLRYSPLITSEIL